jgi:hypothetical protein
MIKIETSPTVAAALLACGLSAAPAQAQGCFAWNKARRDALENHLHRYKRVGQSFVISETWHKPSGAPGNAMPNLVFAGFETFFGH